MPDTATAATKLYDDVGSADGTMYCGSCLDFDGTDDYVENALFSSHQVDAGTIVVWANPRSIGSDGYVLSVGAAIHVITTPIKQHRPIIPLNQLRRAGLAG